MTNTLVKEAVEVANEIDPTNPVVEVAAAAVNTAADPSEANIIADVELAISLVKQLKGLLDNAHPKVSQFIKRLI